MGCALELCEHGPCLLLSQYDGYPGGALRSNQLGEPADILVEHLRVQEQQGAQRLVLRRGAHATLRGEMGEERADLGPSHLLRVALVMEQHEASYPTDVGLLGPATVVPQADGLSELVKQPRRRSGDGLGDWTAFAHAAPEAVHRRRWRRTPRNFAHLDSSTGAPNRGEIGTADHPLHIGPSQSVAGTTSFGWGARSSDGSE